MSILTDVAEGKITFSQGIAQAIAWGQKLTASNPALAAIVNTTISAVKQGASDAVGAVDTVIGAAMLPAAKAVETALDSALATVTKGASIPFNGFVNDGIDQMAASIKAEADAWALKTKAGLVPTAAAVGQGQGGQAIAPAAGQGQPGA